jgi:plasmid stabilization system protein ParE
VNLQLQQSSWFWADLNKQVDWYRDNAGPDVAEEFVDAVEETLIRLARMPGVGRQRFLEWPELAGIHSFRVQKPFQRLLIFYRFTETSLFAERLIHGARDLSGRLQDHPHDE